MPPGAAAVQHQSVGHQSTLGCLGYLVVDYNCSLDLQEENREAQWHCFHNTVELQEGQYIARGHVQLELRQPIQCHDMGSSLGDGDGER